MSSPPAARADRPVVGITASVEVMRSGDWTEETAGTPFAYARAVQRAGGRAVLLVPDDADAEDPTQLLGLTRALIVTGAAGDTDPRHYGQEPHPLTRPVAPARDAFELSLAGRAVESGLPVLGVCRGMQVLNVALGGTLEQHLPDVLGSESHTGPPGKFAEHEVRLKPGSLAARAVGAERTSVKSYHHQGVRDLGEGLEASGWSEPDGIVEAIEVASGRFALGALWHPEEDARSRVIAALVAAAK